MLELVDNGLLSDCELDHQLTFALVDDHLATSLAAVNHFEVLFLFGFKSDLLRRLLSHSGFILLLHLGLALYGLVIRNSQPVLFLKIADVALDF